MPFKIHAPVLVFAALLAARASCAEGSRFGFGHTPSAAQIAALDIDVRPDGQGLPPGQGSARDGAKIFAAACAACHGEKGERSAAPVDPLAGGQGTLTNSKPVKTIGSYWPYASTVFDFIRRAMPFNAPQSLTNDEVYAVTAYLLSLNGIVASDAVLDAETLPRIQMPNRNGFKAADWQHKASAGN